MMGIVLLTVFIATLSLILTLVALVRLSELSGQVARLREEATHQRTGPASVPPVAPRAHEPSPPPVIPAPAAPASRGPEELAEEMLRIETAAGRPEEASTPPPSAPSPGTDWETLVGGKLMNRIGALALIIGVGFFLKYAFDNGWISETVRCLLGAVCGAGLLVGAERTQRKGLAVFSQGLVGAGLAILYLTGYATFNFYHLVSQPVAFVLMALITITAFFEAHRYDARAVALLGWAGGFLTPLLLSTGQANEVGLLTYVALLDAGLLAVSIQKPGWWFLRPLCFLGTFVLFALWADAHYTDEALTPTVFFVVVFWVLFLWAEIMQARSGEAAGERMALALSTVAAISAQNALMGLMESSFAAQRGLVTVFFALAYGITAAAIRRWQKERTIRWSWHALLAAYFLATASVIQFDRFWIITGWAVVIVGCAVVARFAGARFLPSAAGLLGWIASATFIILAAQVDTIVEHPMVFQARGASALALIAALLAGASLLNITPSRWPGNAARWFFDHLAALLLLVALSAETAEWFRSNAPLARSLELHAFFRWLIIPVVWAITAVLLDLAATRFDRIAFSHVAAAAALASAVAVVLSSFTFQPLALPAPVLNVRVAGWLLITASLFATARGFRRGIADPFLLHAGSVAGAVAAILLLLLLTAEIRDSFDQAIERAATDTMLLTQQQTALMNIKQLTLSAGWLFYSLIVMALGLVRRLKGLRILAMVVFGITIIKIFFYDLSFLETLYRIFSFIGLGVILLLVSYLYQKNKQAILGTPAPVTDRMPPTT